MRDPYTILGVAKTADLAEIKKAFRKLAKKYHPDQSKDPKAKERFSEANQAYEIVGDEKKRAAFDRGEIDAEGKPRLPRLRRVWRGRRPWAGPRLFTNSPAGSDRRTSARGFARQLSGGHRSE